MRRWRATTLALFVLIVTCLVTFISCAPIKQGAYFFPQYDGDKSKVLRRDCCGGAGPAEVLVLFGPNKAKYLVLMRQAEEKMEGRIGIYIPKGVTVEFKDYKVTFQMEGDDEQQYQIETIKEADLIYLNPKCLNVVGSDLKTDRQWSSFPSKFEGKGKKGTIIWTSVFLSQPASSKFRLVLPEIAVDGQPFKPLAVDFLFQESGTYIYPLNC